MIRQLLLFFVGGSCYVGLELLYRGRSHSSMFAAGGVSFLLLGKLSQKPLSLPAKALLGMLTVTGVELGTGLLVNRDHRVWDYRDQPFHYKGQICLGFMLLWLPLSLLGMGLYALLDRGVGWNRCN